MLSAANVSAEESLIVLAVADVALAMTVPPVIVSAPAKLGLSPGVTVAPLATPPTANVLPVVLVSVMVVALEIALMNQLPVKPVAVTGCPGTRFAVLAIVSMGAVVVPVLTALVVRPAVAPVTVPSVIVVPVLVAF